MIQTTIGFPPALKPSRSNLKKRDEFLLARVLVDIFHPELKSRRNAEIAQYYSRIIA